MDACIILHNMIVEDERDGYLHTDDYEQFNSEVLSDDVANGPSAAYAPAFAPAFTTYCEKRRNMREKTPIDKLQADLVEHIWERFGIENNDE